MVLVLNYLVFLLIFMLSSISEGLERAKLNTNAANFDFLLKESGRDAANVGGQQGYPSLPQQSMNNKDGGKTGRVHDLVDFYNNQGKVNPPLKPISYSSAVSGSKNNQNSNLNGGNIAGNRAMHATGGNHQNVPTSAPNKPDNSGPLVNPGKQPNGANSHKQGVNPQTPNLGPQTQGLYPDASRNKETGPATTPKTTFPSKAPTKQTFSDIVSGGGKNSAKLPANSPSSGSPTSKPSFSTVVAGGARPTMTTNKPTNTPVLPSHILANKNQGARPANGNAPTDLELQTLSEDLLRKDTNNAAKLITVNYQEKTTSQSKEDKAPKPLFTIPTSVYNIPTIEKFLPLLDNYERDTLVNEYVTPQERNEENAFMDAIMQTQVIRQLMTFLKEKGYVTPDPRQQRDFLKQLWFNLYSRGKGKISSSGFEHVFVSELKNSEISGLHNWLYFAKEESANRANYLGYLKYTQLNDKGAVLKFHFNQQGTDKPVDAMFVGTSPELEIALYSLCFVTRADQQCPLKLGGKNIDIVTHTFRYRSKNMIGSAYPQIV